jgi:hypothetical protein
MLVARPAFGKSAVEAANQNVRINESGHACTDPPASSLSPVLASGVRPWFAGGSVLWPDQTAGGVIPDLPSPGIWREG